VLFTRQRGRSDYAGCSDLIAVQLLLDVWRRQLDFCMTRNEFKQWLEQRLAEVEATIDRPATAHEANIVFEAKKYAYALRLYGLANMMPERKLKTPLDCCLRLRECLGYLESPPPVVCDDDSLIELKEAARILGYSVDRTRRLAKKGEIRHVQVGRGRIKFRREWLDECVSANSAGPRDIKRSPAQTRTTPVVIESRYGFDNSFFRSNL
jgi:excisionase family DNA binding protein